MQNFKNELDWDLARVFLAVAREGQLLGAARALDLDHATVTRRINALEAALGVRLFERRTTGSTLTGAGRRLLDHVTRIETELLDARAQLSQEAASLEGTVRVGAPDGFGTLFLASRFAPLLKAHPGLVVQLVPLPRSFSMSKREADIAITVERPAAGRLRVRKLTGYGLSLYASAAYLADAPPLKTRRDLEHHLVVSYVGDLLFTPVLDFSTDLGLSRPPRFQCASVLGQIEAVRSGLGVGLLHDYAAPADDPVLRLVLPSVAVTRSYWLVTHADVAAALPVRTVIDHIVAEVAAAGPLFLPRR